MFKINISIERNKDGYLVTPSDIGGIHSQAKTRKEALELAKKEVELKLLDFNPSEIEELKSREIFTSTLIIDID